MYKQNAQRAALESFGSDQDYLETGYLEVLESCVPVTRLTLAIRN